jgi:SET domain-containing protein
MGVFAALPIPKGELVMEFGGEVISREQTESGNYRLRSIWPVRENVFIALPESDTELSLDEYLNHSCDANAWLDDEVTLTARRDIAAGEEITLDQGTWNFDGGYIEDGTPCTCGAKNCRRMLNEDDWTLPDLQKRYRGHFHPLVRASKRTRAVTGS